MQSWSVRRLWVCAGVGPEDALDAIQKPGEVHLGQLPSVLIGNRSESLAVRQPLRITESG